MVPRLISVDTDLGLFSCRAQQIQGSTYIQLMLEELRTYLAYPYRVGLDVYNRILSSCKNNYASLLQLPRAISIRMRTMEHCSSLCHKVTKYKIRLSPYFWRAFSFDFLKLFSFESQLVLRNKDQVKVRLSFEKTLGCDR